MDTKSATTRDLAESLAAPDVQGVCEFIEAESFQAQTFQFVYKAGSIIGTSFTISSHSDPSLFRRSGTVHCFDRVPELVANWQRLTQAASVASCCQSDVLDGTTYYNRLKDRSQDFWRRWSNPSAKEQPRQCALIEAYNQLIEVASLSPIESSLRHQMLALRVGQTVRLQNCTFHGESGEVIRADRDHVVVQISVFGKPVPVEVSATEIDFVAS